MAEPIFKTIDFSKQIAEDQARTNAANLAGIQNLANTYVAGRQENINQARQLMSDFDAVINEVDDMHKENVSEEIAKTQQQLANNIYKKKGKNGVRLQLGDMNSEDFNYARDMRKLKNLATNSRMSRENLDRARDYAKNHKYFENSQQRTAYLAEVATFYSDSKTLNSSPKQVQEADRDLRLQYTDVASEAKDIILKEMPLNATSKYRIDENGNEIKTIIKSYGDLFDGEDISEDKLTEHAQLYIDRTGGQQTDLEGIKDRLRSSAMSTIEDRSRTKEDINLKKAQANRQNNLANNPRNTVDNTVNDLGSLTTRMVADPNPQVKKVITSSVIQAVESNPKVNSATSVTGPDEYAELMINRRNEFDITDLPEGFVPTRVEPSGLFNNYTPGDPKGGYIPDKSEHKAELDKQLTEFYRQEFGLENLNKSVFWVEYNNNNKSEMIDLTNLESRTALSNILLNATDKTGLELFIQQTNEQVNLTEKVNEKAEEEKPKPDNASRFNKTNN